VALVQKSAFALFHDFARPVKHMRFPAQTRESPHFRASIRGIVKHILRTSTVAGRRALAIAEAARPSGSYCVPSKGADAIAKPANGTCAAKLRAWSVSLMRSRAHSLGTVYAAGEKAVLRFAFLSYSTGSL
jgi:hypothetical protein